MCIRKFGLAIAILALQSAAAGAQYSSRYEACIDQTKSDPNLAFENALLWREEGGGLPARHCEALAMVALSQFASGATRLEALADEPRARDDLNRAALLAQAGNAWILEGALERADAALTKAVSLDPSSPDILADRARVRSLMGDWQWAEADLTTAIGLSGDRVEFLVARGVARRELTDRSGALADLSQALLIEPTNAAALLERGVIHGLSYNYAKARADFAKIVEHHSDGPEVDAARAYLAQINTNDLTAD
jgi:tetratricopeptide (TPR) repeat protein